MNQILWLQQNPLFFWVLVAAIGLCIGSFLNVVIYRLPLMIAQEEKMFTFSSAANDEAERLNLFFPASTCPQCHHKIKPWHNIPLFGYFWLKGKCHHCQAPISLIYPAIEVFTACLTMLIAYQFGFDEKTIWVCILTWFLIAASFIDLKTRLLPDLLTYPLLWLGLLINLHGTFASLNDAVIGAVSGYLFLWAVYHLFRWLTGKEGMGYGDFKLFAALGAWLGWSALPAVILLASIMGSLIGIVYLIATRAKSSPVIPFGPFLAAAGLITLVFKIDLYYNLLF